MEQTLVCSRRGGRDSNAKADDALDAEDLAGSLLVPLRR
jgi:hypothetical protein